MRTAVILLNLGGPLKEADIQPYLHNFFMDKNIIGAPHLVRRFLAWRISSTRAKGAARVAYGRLGFKSPLLENTEAQGAALEAALGAGYRVFTAMRYWHPFAHETAKEVKAYAPDEVVLLPLYPQFSTATVKSALEDWDVAAKAEGLPVASRRACCWFTNDGFISASAARIRDALGKAPAGTRLLFSAHGLPEKTVKAGDPYQWQCERTADAIVEKLNMPGLDWSICYQSRAAFRC